VAPALGLGGFKGTGATGATGLRCISAGGPTSRTNRRSEYSHPRVVRRNPVRMTSHTSRLGMGGVMSKFERLLVAGSTELPDCRCATEMRLTAIVPVPGGDTEIRIFRCPDCSHELRLTAWRNSAA
jgi:hypothetical protein